METEAASGISIGSIVLLSVLIAGLITIGVLTVTGRLRSLWFNRHGLLRVAWRLFVFALLFVVVGYGAMYAMAYGMAIAGMSDGNFSIGEGPLPVQILGYLVLTLVVFGISALAVRLLDRRPVAGLGLGLNSRWLRQLCAGLLLGIIFTICIVAVQMLTATLRLSPAGVASDVLLKAGLLYLLVCIGIAFFEELIFRGYLLQVLAEGIGDFAGYLGKKKATRFGMIAASILLAGPFGLAHCFNEGGTMVGAVATGMGGLMLSIAYFRTRSLWLPVGIHITWNFFLGYMFALPVSGETVKTVPFVADISGPEWLSGGTFGPEGSILCFTSLVVLAVYLLRSQQCDATEDAVEAYPPQRDRLTPLVPDQRN